MLLTNLLIYLILMFMFYLTMNPLFMALILLILSFSLFMTAGLITSSWFGMSILLIFSGGMMIVFLYMTSLCSNYKFNYSFSTTYLVLCLLTQTPTLKTSFVPLNQNFSLFFLYNSMNWHMFMFMILYIIFTLLFVVMLSQFYQGSLKKSY